MKDACRSRDEAQAQALLQPHALASATVPIKAGIAAVDPEAEGSSVTSKRLSRIDWATLLKRVHTVDALACPECGGRMHFTALVQDKAVARKELQRRGLPCQPPPLARARAPDWDAA